MQAELERERSLRVEAQETAHEMEMNVLVEGSKWKAEIDKYKDALRMSSADSSLPSVSFSTPVRAEDRGSRLALDLDLSRINSAQPESRATPRMMVGARSMPGSRSETPRLREPMNKAFKTGEQSAALRATTPTKSSDWKPRGILTPRHHAGGAGRSRSSSPPAPTVCERWQAETRQLRAEVMRLESTLIAQQNVTRTCRDCGGSAVTARVELVGGKFVRDLSGDFVAPSEQQQLQRRERWAELDEERRKWAARQQDAVDALEQRVEADSTDAARLRDEAMQSLEQFKEEKEKRVQDAAAWKKAMAVVELNTARRVEEMQQVLAEQKEAQAQTEAELQATRERLQSAQEICAQLPTLETNLCEEIARHVTMQSELDSAEAERKTLSNENSKLKEEAAWLGKRLVALKRALDPHIFLYIYVDIDTHIYTHTHTHTHTHTYTDTRTHTHKYIHTHTHTLTQVAGAGQGSVDQSRRVGPAPHSDQRAASAGRGRRDCARGGAQGKRALCIGGGGGE